MKTKFPAYLLLVLTLMALVGARSTLAQERFIYWIGAVDAEETRGNTIFRYSLDSSVVDTLVQATELGPNERYFYYVTVDTLRRQIYWTDSGGREPNGVELIGAIRRASLEGDSVEVFLGGIVCGVGAPSDIELDTVGETLYWGESSDCVETALNSVDLERPNPNQWQSLPTSGTYVVSAIELDMRNNMLYWTNNDWISPPREPLGVRRAPLNNTAADEVIIAGSICDIALAHTLSKIYWISCNSRTIRSSNLDGAEVEDVIVSEGDVSNLAIDQKSKKIYWTETSEGKISRANLDGTEEESLLSGLVVPTSIALTFGWDVRVGVEAEETLPDGVNLQGTYPNPVQESATITFSLAKSAHVTLEIYDQLGRRIEVLVSRTYPAGNFHIQWSPIDQANGVYFCRVTSDNVSKTIPLVLQR